MANRNMVKLDDISCAWEIKQAARAEGLDEIELVLTSGAMDAKITVYDLGDGNDTYRVIDTNADPIWEEQDLERFREVLGPYGYTTTPDGRLVEESDA